MYIDQPRGYKRKGEKKLFKLKKALYGLKQASRAWYSRIDAYFAKLGFHKCPFEHTLYVKTEEGGKLLIVCLYVDDLIFTRNDDKIFDEFKKSMMTEFEMTDLGLMHYFLGLDVIQTTVGNFIYQKKYAQDILKRFRMDDCKPFGTPAELSLKLCKDKGGKEVDSTFYKQIIGSLMYLTFTRPDIMYVVSLVSRYMEKPTEMHLMQEREFSGM